MSDQDLKNRLHEAVKRPDALDDNVKVIIKAIEAQFTRPVSVGIVVALGGGDAFDTLIAGTMDPSVIEVCIRSLNQSEFEQEVINRRTLAATKPANATDNATDNATATDDGRPPSISADLWGRLPAALKDLVRVAGDDIQVFVSDGDDLGALDDLDDED